jgi:ABC-2 type transport system ATP-binding protein
VIKATGLTKEYGAHRAVDGLDLEVGAGELFCFLGPNGAGKSTTIKMLNGMLRPTSGRAEVAGVDVWANPLKAKSHLGYVPDSPTLYEKLSAREFLAFVGDIYRVEPARRNKRIEELLSMFGLSESADGLLEGYSHGMKQKICIAAALLHQPKVIFLDEPTVGLDPQSARLIKDILRELCGKGVTVFMSTHILEIAERMADRIGIIQKGRLIFTGTVGALRATAAHGEEGREESLEDLFLELTGGREYEEVSRYLEG